MGMNDREFISRQAQSIIHLDLDKSISVLNVIIRLKVIVAGIVSLFIIVELILYLLTLGGNRLFVGTIIGLRKNI